VFGAFNGLPIHALILHVAVLLTPLAALLGIALLIPKWRSRLRWPLVVVTAVATIVVYVTRESGFTLKTNLGTGIDGTPVGDAIDEHQTLGTRLLIAVAVLLVLAVVFAVVIPRLGAGWAGTASSAVVAVVGIAVIVLTVQTGEAGAKAVWNPTGTQDYSAR
jgi:glucan phosphoethanolaminetransferase (alkaline phosphatase superfamily)